MAGVGRAGGRRLIRTALAVVLAALAGLGAPASVVLARADALVSDTEEFVATYAPVAGSAPVQQLLVRDLSSAIVRQLGMGEGGVAQTIVERVVAEAAGTEAFAQATTTGLRLAHAELLALLSGEPGRVEVADGVVRLRFAPFVDALTTRLGEAGVPFLDRLPEVTGGVPLLEVDPALVPALQAGYRLLGAAATWLPWLTVALLCAAVAVWPGVRTALVGAGACLAGGVLTVWMVSASVASGVLGRLGEGLAGVAGELARVTVSPLLSPLLALAVAGAVVAGVAWLSLPARD